jgi:hypothetical protein
MEQHQAATFVRTRQGRARRVLDEGVSLSSSPVRQLAAAQWIEAVRLLNSFIIGWFRANTIFLPL